MAWAMGEGQSPVANNVPDVSDPWYTGDFETAYQDILVSCQAMLNNLKKD